VAPLPAGLPGPENEPELALCPWARLNGSDGQLEGFGWPRRTSTSRRRWKLAPGSTDGKRIQAPPLMFHAATGRNDSDGFKYTQNGTPGPALRPDATLKERVGFLPEPGGADDRSLPLRRAARRAFAQWLPPGGAEKPERYDCTPAAEGVPAGCWLAGLPISQRHGGPSTSLHPLATLLERITLTPAILRLRSAWPLGVGARLYLVDRRRKCLTPFTDRCRTCCTSEQNPNQKPEGHSNPQQGNPVTVGASI